VIQKREVKKAKLLPLLLVIATCGFAQEKKQLLVGDDAPQFSIAWWLKGKAGGVESGKVNVVEFWATWCAPCIGNFPHLSEVAEKYKSKDVSVYGISIFERKGVELDSLKRFVAGPKGETMHFVVGADDTSKFMATNWVRAAGQRGIPFSMIVDQNGKIAWMGHPILIDKPLEQIVAGSWNLKKERLKFIENKRLDSVDGSMITQFNGYITNKNYSAGLLTIDSLLKKEPGLKYRHYTSHFTFVYLVNTDPEKAASFARETWAHNEIPDWKGVSDMVFYVASKKMKMPSSLYILGADALQAQIDHYPWAMNEPVTYDQIANFYFLANEKQKAIDAENKAIAKAKDSHDINEKQLTDFQTNLEKYKKM